MNADVACFSAARRAPARRFTVNSWVSPVTITMLALAMLLGGGCATSRRSIAESAAQLPEGEILARAMDPMRPPANRVKWAQELGPTGRAKLERRILAELPELWGLEWRARLALLEVVGGSDALAALQRLDAQGGVPQDERAQSAIDAAIQRLQGRASAAHTAVPARGTSGSR